MRLTPSWLRSSESPSDDERSGDERHPAVPIHYSSHRDTTTGESTGSSPDATADEYVPDSEETLRSIIEELDTPTTVDSIVDQLLESADSTIETWAAVHERLYEDRLPALDETGAIEFDPERGTVEVPPSTSSSGVDASMPVVAFAVVGLLFVFVIAWMTSVLTALTFTFVVVTLVAWFVPLSGFF